MIVFAVLVTAAISYAPSGIGQLLIVSGYHAAVAAYGHILCRIEREAPGLTDRADLSSFDFSAVCLACIFNQAEACLDRNVMEFINSRWMSVEVNWHQCSSFGAYLRPSLAWTQVYS